MNIQKILIVMFCVNFFGAFAAFGQLGVIANEKANVFYLGLEYPMSVAVAGVPSQNIVLKAVGTDTETKQTGEGTYIVRPTSTQSISLQVRDRKTDKLYAEYKYRVEKLPMPIVSFYNQIPNEKGVIYLTSGAMQAQMGISPYIPNFDMNLKFEVVSYTFYYTKRRCESVEYKSESAKFLGDIANAIKSARPGDMYSFVDIRVQIPGEPTTRLINSLTVYIR
jgi:hypothetical protein